MARWTRWTRPTRSTTSGCGPKLRRLPSEYYREHGFASFQEDPAGLDLAEPMDLADNFMWANDYPHHEGTWPHSAEAIERTMGQLSDAARANDPRPERRALLRLRGAGGAPVSPTAPPDARAAGAHRAAGRVVDILELVVAARDGLALRELSAQLDAPKSSLLPLLRTLAARGLPRAGPGGEYRLGPGRSSSAWGSRPGAGCPRSRGPRCGR